MTANDLQDLCELGQRQLMEMAYLEAEKTLVRAEGEALTAADFDTLARLYMPLQEARRQRRQRCGEGVVCLDLIAQGPDDHRDARKIIDKFPHGQLLVAGWGTLSPAVEVRRLVAERGIYVETFLAAVYPAGAGRVVVIAPTEDVSLPEPVDRPVDVLLRQLPAQSVVLGQAELPVGRRAGTVETYGQVMAMWEKLHATFLAAGDMTADLGRKIEAYRQAIRVDYACELAHQRLAAAARELARQRRAAPASI